MRKLILLGLCMVVLISLGVTATINVTYFNVSYNDLINLNLDILVGVNMTSADNNCSINDTHWGSPDITYNYCYQETATDAINGTHLGRNDDCELNYTGNYSFLPFAGSNFIFYIVYAKPPNAQNNSLWQVKFGHNTTTNETIDIKNITIPEGCMNNSPTLKLKINATLLGDYPYIESYCWNNSGGDKWGRIGLNFSADVSNGVGNKDFDSCNAPRMFDGDWDTHSTPRYDGFTSGVLGIKCHGEDARSGNYTIVRIYEEAMWWNISASYFRFKPNGTIPDGNYSINVSCVNNTDNGSNELRLNVISLDNCTTANTTSLHFSFMDIENGVNTIGVGSYTIFYNETYYDGNIFYKNYSATMDDSNFSLCIYPNWTTTTTSEMLINYNISDTIFNYFMQEINIDNETQFITLYGQGGTTQIQFRVLDFLGNTPIENAYIKVMKYDIGTGDFKTTEILKTDSQGNALGNVVLGTVWYKFLIQIDGETKLVTEPEQFPLTATIRTFRINLEESWYDNFDITLGVETNLTFNEVTNNFRYEWNDPSGSMHKACLMVEKINVTGNQILMDNCTTSTAGTLLFFIGNDNSSGHWIATGYLEYDDNIVTNILEKIFYGTWKMFTLAKDEAKPMGLFTSMLFVGTMGLIGIWSPMAAIILTLIGVITTSIIGLYQITLGALVTMIILGVVLIWKLTRQ